MGDLDLGEHFHNFPLHQDLQVYCGIDVRPYYGRATKGRGKTMWFRWVRCMMGLRTSPYNTIQTTHLAYKVANGNQWDVKNALQWEDVVFNLPGSPAYNPFLGFIGSGKINPWLVPHRLMWMIYVQWGIANHTASLCLSPSCTFHLI